MTTSETTTPRPVMELLDLDTYQGMTDEEIESVITWKCEQAARAALATQESTLLKQELEQRILIAHQSAEQTLSMVKSCLGQTSTMGVISYEQA